MNFYLARLEAAKRGASPAAIAAAIRAILDEQTVALRSLTQRRQAAGRQALENAPARPQETSERPL